MNAWRSVRWTLVQTMIVISEDSSTKSLYKVEATHHLHSVSLKFLNCRLHKLRRWKLCKVHILRPLWWPATHRSGCPNHTRSSSCHCCIYHFPQNPSTWTPLPYIHAMSDWWCSLLQEVHLPQCTWVKLQGYPLLCCKCTCTAAWVQQPRSAWNAKASQSLFWFLACKTD